jgi:hypothetical protein
LLLGLPGLLQRRVLRLLLAAVTRRSPGLCVSTRSTGVDERRLKFLRRFKR